MTTPTVAPVDPTHVAELSALTTLAEKIRYACECVPRPTTREVREWLHAHGVDASRSHIGTVVRSWRTDHNLGDTGDLVTMTPELLAELDALNTTPDDLPTGPHATALSAERNTTTPTRAAAPMPPAPAPASPKLLRWASGAAWVVVLAAALGISWWSLFDYAANFMPKPLAAGVSLVFDAAALIVAGLAHRYATSPYSGIGPRLALLALLAGSVHLNWQHAAGLGYGVDACIMFAAPAAVAIVLFELHTGWHSRTERAARGRLSKPLPLIGLAGWLLHPLQSLVTVWTVSRARGRAIRQTELAQITR